MTHEPDLFVLVAAFITAGAVGYIALDTVIHVALGIVRGRRHKVAVQRNPGGGTTQTGYGKHADRRTRRLRTRQAIEDAALEEWDDDLATGSDADVDTHERTRELRGDQR